MTPTQSDLFAKPTRRTTRKSTPPAPVRKIDPAVVAAVARFSWWPLGPGCGGQAGREMVALATRVLRSDPDFRPPLDPHRTSCDEALIAIVDVMRLIGAGQAGISFGPEIDKAFANAIKFTAKQNRQPIQKSRRGPAKA